MVFIMLLLIIKDRAPFHTEGRAQELELYFWGLLVLVALLRRASTFPPREKAWAIVGKAGTKARAWSALSAGLQCTVVLEALIYGGSAMSVPMFFVLLAVSFLSVCYELSDGYMRVVRQRNVSE
jgi:hypothetical protein